MHENDLKMKKKKRVLNIKTTEFKSTITDHKQDWKDDVWEDFLKIWIEAAVLMCSGNEFHSFAPSQEKRSVGKCDMLCPVFSDSVQSSWIWAKMSILKHEVQQGS